MNTMFDTDRARDDELIVVDEHDQMCARATKEQVHTHGLLHRAFSVVLTREGEQGYELLVVKRAEGKYHSGGLWTNSCCSHPRVGEDLKDAATRRVAEELGVQIEHLREVGSFVYRAEFDNGLVEHEYDHVLVAPYDGDVCPNPEEACDVRWVPLESLKRELHDAPGSFTAWAPQVFEIVCATLEGEQTSIG